MQHHGCHSATGVIVQPQWYLFFFLSPTQASGWRCCPRYPTWDQIPSNHSQSRQVISCLEGTACCILSLTHTTVKQRAQPSCLDNNRQFKKMGLFAAISTGLPLPWRFLPSLDWLMWGSHIIIPVWSNLHVITFWQARSCIQFQRATAAFMLKFCLKGYSVNISANILLSGWTAL